jgi:hypothetical protein
MAFLFLQNGGNSSPKKTFNYIININFKISKKSGRLYDDFKD